MYTADLPNNPFYGSSSNQAFSKQKNNSDHFVMVIDSDKDTIDFFERFLTNENCTMISAHSLNDALEESKKNKISLVVSEFLLGDHSCLEIMMLLRKQMPNLPVAIMSRHEDLISEKDALNFSANYFLSKPIETEKLHQIIGNCINQYELFS